MDSTNVFISSPEYSNMRTVHMKFCRVTVELYNDNCIIDQRHEHGIDGLTLNYPNGYVVGPEQKERRYKEYFFIVYYDEINILHFLLDSPAYRIFKVSKECYDNTPIGSFINISDCLYKGE